MPCGVVRSVFTRAPLLLLTDAIVCSLGVAKVASIAHLMPRPHSEAARSRKMPTASVVSAGSFFTQARLGGGEVRFTASAAASATETSDVRSDLCAWCTVITWGQGRVAPAVAPIDATAADHSRWDSASRLVSDRAVVEGESSRRHVGPVRGILRFERRPAALNQELCPSRWPG